MYLTAFSRWLGQITQPDHLLYHPIQMSLFASLTYIGTTCLTTRSPLQAATLAALTYNISQFVTPRFIKYFEPNRDVTLAPWIGQCCQLAVSLFLAKITCNLAGQKLSFNDAKIISIAFGVSCFVAHFALRKFREAIAEG